MLVRITKYKVGVAASAAALVAYSARRPPTLNERASSSSASSSASSSSASTLENLSRVWAPPPFSSTAPSRFDLSTYVGRALHYLDTLGDLSMLTVDQTRWSTSKRLLHEHASGQGEGAAASDAQLWRARKIEAACVHPETGVLVPAPFRFAAFAPVNLFICSGLLWASGVSLRASAFFQWFNQSYNVGVNHCNRSSASPPPERLAAAYICATLSSVGIALGLQHLGARHLHGRGRLLQLTVPMLGVSVGAIVNLMLTRSQELQNGIPVTDADGRELGTSELAAQYGLGQCAATRVAWTVALLTLAPVASTAALRVLPAGLPRSIAAVVDVGSTFGVIWISVPLCIAIFPQHTDLPGTRVEERFAAHERVFFNKGL